MEDPYTVRYETAGKDGMCGIDGEGVLPNDIVALSENILNKAGEPGWCTVRVKDPVHILAEFCHKALSQCPVEVARVWKGHSMVLPGTLYRVIVC